MATGDKGTHFSDGHNHTACGTWMPNPFSAHVTYKPDWRKVPLPKRCPVCDRKVKQ